MGAARNVGRIIGVLLLVQGASGVVVNFVLLGPVITAPAGWLVSVADNSLQVSLSVLIALAADALSIGIAIAAFPVFRQYSHRMSLWLLALAIASFSLVAVENITVLSMLSLSQAYAQANAADGDLFQTLRVVVGSARNWAHYTHLIVVGSVVFVLYSVLYRFALIPRALAAFGQVATLLQIIAVTMPLFGHRIVFLMLLPLGLSHLASALWLIARGLDERPHEFRAGDSSITMRS